LLVSPNFFILDDAYTGFSPSVVILTT
jgi:hypothetical protein